MSFLSLCNCRWKKCTAPLPPRTADREITSVNYNRSDSVAAFSLPLVSMLREMHVRQLQVAAGISKGVSVKNLLGHQTLLAQSAHL